MTVVPRYLIEKGPDDVKTAFGAIPALCEKHGASQITLVIPQKQRWEARQDLLAKEWERLAGRGGDAFDHTPVAGSRGLYVPQVQAHEGAKFEARNS